MATVLVNGGHAITSARVKGTGTEPLNVGWGTGATAAVVAATGISTEVDVDLAGAGPARTVGTSSIVTTTLTNDTYQVVATRTATGAGTVTNAGTFNTAGDLYVLGSFTGIGLAIGDAIEFTVKVKYS